MRRDRSALAENPYVKNENALTPQERAAMQAPGLDPEVQKHLTNFSLITHGFGGPAMVAVLNAFRHYLNSMRANYEKCMNLPPNAATSAAGERFMNVVDKTLINGNSYKSSNNNSQSYFNGLASLKVESKD